MRTYADLALVSDVHRVLKAVARALSDTGLREFARHTLVVTQFETGLASSEPSALLRAAQLIIDDIESTVVGTAGGEKKGEEEVEAGEASPERVMPPSGLSAPHLDHPELDKFFGANEGFARMVLRTCTAQEMDSLDGAKGELRRVMQEQVLPLLAAHNAHKPKSKKEAALVYDSVNNAVCIRHVTLDVLRKEAAEGIEVLHLRQPRVYAALSY